MKIAQLSALPRRIVVVVALARLEWRRKRQQHSSTAAQHTQALRTEIIRFSQDRAFIAIVRTHREPKRTEISAAAATHRIHVSSA